MSKNIAANPLIVVINTVIDTENTKKISIKSGLDQGIATSHVEITTRSMNATSKICTSLMRRENQNSRSKKKLS